MTAFDRDFTMTIDGQGLAGAARMPVLNPATETVVASAPLCSEAELDAAVAAARAAFPGWRATPIETRRAAVRRIGEVIGANMADFTRLFTLEQG
ncbi:MAG: aldehyde dehydrogenase, partial [Sphingomonas sp.]